MTRMWAQRWMWEWDLGLGFHRPSLLAQEQRRVAFRTRRCHQPTGWWWAQGPNGRHLVRLLSCSLKDNQDP